MIQPNGGDVKYFGAMRRKNAANPSISHHTLTDNVVYAQVFVRLLLSAQDGFEERVVHRGRVVGAAGGCAFADWGSGRGRTGAAGRIQVKVGLTDPAGDRGILDLQP